MKAMILLSMLTILVCPLGADSHNTGNYYRFEAEFAAPYKDLVTEEDKASNEKNFYYFTRAAGTGNRFYNETYSNEIYWKCVAGTDSQGLCVDKLKRKWNAAGSTTDTTDYASLNFKYPGTQGNSYIAEGYLYIAYALDWVPPTDLSTIIATVNLSVMTADGSFIQCTPESADPDGYGTVIRAGDWKDGEIVYDAGGHVMPCRLFTYKVILQDLSNFGGIYSEPQSYTLRNVNPQLNWAGDVSLSIDYIDMYDTNYKQMKAERRASVLSGRAE